jgi:glycosyltransferase involved in cell wall biosynthesis
MARVYFDVTQLAHWGGKITGIPRVMDELAKRYHADPSADVRFMCWVKDVQDFCEIDFARTILARDGLVYLHGEEQSEGPVSASTPSRTAPTTHLLKRAAKKGLRVAGKVSPRIADKLERRAKQQYAASYRRVAANTGDIFFIPWGEWWDPHFTDRLVRAHDEDGVRLIQIIHDVAPTVWPQFYEQVDVNPSTYNARIIPIADMVLCVSQNTKRELIAWLQQQRLHVPRIEVFRLGDQMHVTKPVKPANEAFKAAKLQGNDYLLVVGTFEAKKNHALFYSVYKLAKARGIDLPKLVIVGRQGYGTENIYNMMTLDPEVGGQFVFQHDTSDEELSWLYDHCLFTVLPSFHEGWGIPIAESVGRGVPCLCSNTSSMVEIAEGIVEHFSPASTDECLAGIQRWLVPKNLEAARKRTERYKPTSWDDTYRQVRAFVA